METFNPAAVEQAPKPRSLVLAEQLEQLDDIEEIKSVLGEFLDSVEADLNVELVTDPSDLYKLMEREGCLARVERMTRVLEAIETDKEFSISDEEETHYANAVVPNEHGIRLAFAEGQAPGPVRTMIAFGKTLVGFKTDHVRVEEVDFEADDIRDIPLRRNVCRHVVGTVEPEDIRCVVMRIPRGYLDDRHLTPDEVDEPDLPFVFRGFEHSVSGK